ncbi:MAG: 2-hydroxyacyl-CoA dehydratase subunit D [Planctomycetota bacterium]|jgi:benzoyl-CoA reductase/2-hydroxyglutaryl-CoA dehydratase subunit BcrC/BadD/HgdB
MANETVKRVEIKAQQELRALLRDHFLDLDEAAGDPGRRVAWCSSVGPCEILSAFGFEVYFPENHGALLGAKKVSHEYIPRAVGAGYCPESCSYMNSDIGAALVGHSPLQDAYGIDGPPTPDLLVYSTNQCREVQDWFSFFGRRHEAPVLGVCPPPHLGEVTPDHVAFVRGEMARLIEHIEEHFGLTLNGRRLEEVVDRSSRASTGWWQVLDTARARPSPLTFWDGLIHMAPVILLRGSRAAVDYYDRLLAEMQERVKGGIGAVPGERWRLYWEGMPIWPKTRVLSEKFFELHAVIAASTYCNSWAFAPYDGGDPLAWMARTGTEIFINRDENTKQAFLVDMFDRFAIDGAIFHNARTCPNNTNSRFGMAQRLRDEQGLPVLVIDGDLSDVRFFSTAQTMTNLEAFIEQLEGRAR